MAWWWVAMVGYILSLSTMATTGGVCLFLMNTGFTRTLVWVTNAIPRPPAERSVAMGLINGSDKLGSV
ncbi:hypothetical protein BDR04DRAFT_1092316 [Suillus decipiens]|nr:hypothetical protein BDR04DRAFT_1092316 [Suillus decipiens]